MVTGTLAFTEVMGYSNVLKKDVEKDADQLDKILEDTKKSESIEQQQQANNVLVHAMVQEAKENTKKLDDLVVILSNKAVLELADREDSLRVTNPFEAMGNSEGFTKMLEQDRKNDEYTGGRKD